MKLTLYYQAIRYKFNEPPKAQERVVERELVKEKIVSNLHGFKNRTGLVGSTRNRHQIRSGYYKKPEITKKNGKQ